MSVHLIGGGWAEDESAWTGRFVAEARERAEGRPTIAVVLWAPTVAEGESWHAEYESDLAKHDCEVRFVQLAADRPLDASDLVGADGVFVGGGLTPGYHAAVMPAAQAIRELVADGTPYAGLSAGAMIAGDVALLGGWRIGGVEVTQQASSEGLDDVTLAEGIGLVDVHAAQHGTLGRAVAIVDADLVERTVAIDERTSLVVGEQGLAAAGEGNVYVCTKDGPHVQVAVLGGR